MRNRGPQFFPTDIRCYSIRSEETTATNAEWRSLEGCMIKSVYRNAVLEISILLSDGRMIAFSSGDPVSLVVTR